MYITVFFSLLSFQAICAAAQHVGAARAIGCAVVVTAQPMREPDTHCASCAAAKCVLHFKLQNSGKRSFPTAYSYTI